jgi:hypothetical protein
MNITKILAEFFSTTRSWEYNLLGRVYDFDTLIIEIVMGIVIGVGLTAFLIYLHERNEMI